MRVTLVTPVTAGPVELVVRHYRSRSARVSGAIFPATLIGPALPEEQEETEIPALEVLEPAVTQELLVVAVVPAQQ